MDKSLQEILKSIRDKFKDELRVKTGWGRNEVIGRYDYAVSQALLEYKEKQNV